MSAVINKFILSIFHISYILYKPRNQWHVSSIFRKGFLSLVLFQMLNAIQILCFPSPFYGWNFNWSLHTSNSFFKCCQSSILLPSLPLYFFLIHSLLLLNGDHQPKQVLWRIFEMDIHPPGTRQRPSLILHMTFARYETSFLEVKG